MPAGAKMSMASMNAEPMMPKMSRTSLATSVSTNASEGVILVTPWATWRAGSLAVSVIDMPLLVFWRSENRNAMLKNQDQSHPRIVQARGQCSVSVFRTRFTIFRDRATLLG